jgi:uncharacterized protein YcaQ
MSQPSVTWEHAIAFRARRQFLEERVGPKRLLEVVSGLAGLHAQVMSSAELTLWARVEGLEPGDLREALWKRRSLVKLWAMRGTLHLLPSSEYSLWQAALDTRTNYLTPAWSKWFGIPQDRLDLTFDAIGRVLRGARLTRQELAEAVVRETGDEIEALRAGWGSALKPASYRGLLCFAPDRGRNVTFTSPSTWLRAKDRSRRAPAGDAVLGEVLRRFVSAHGPATREETARWWGGFSAAKAERILRSVDGLVEVDLDGARAWIDAGDVDALLAAEPTTTVRLLPTFDQYVIGSTSSAERLLPRDGLRDRVHRQAGWVSPVVTVGGRIEGVWSHERKGGSLRLTVEPFRRRSARLREGVEGEAERLAAFLGGTLELTWA